MTPCVILGSSIFLATTRSGQVSTVVITREHAVATDRQGRMYDVTLSSDTSSDAKVLTPDGVTVTFREQAGGAYWLEVLIPNLILLLLIGGGVVAVVRAVRR